MLKANPYEVLLRTWQRPQISSEGFGYALVSRSGADDASKAHKASELDCLLPSLGRSALHSNDVFHTGVKILKCRKQLPHNWALGPHLLMLGTFLSCLTEV